MTMKRTTTACLAAIVVAAVACDAIAQTRDGPESRAGEAAESVNVRYARTYLSLAKTELEIAEDANRRIGTLYPEITVQRLRNNVAFAEAQLKYELAGDEGDLHDVHLRELDGALKLAEAKLQKGLSMKKRLPQTVSDLEILRLRLAAEVARLTLERARSPQAQASPHAHLQWQLDQLRRQVLRLQVRADQLTTRQ